MEGTHNSKECIGCSNVLRDNFFRNGEELCIFCTVKEQNGKKFERDNEGKIVRKEVVPAI